MPSLLDPLCHLTNPFSIDRDALPLPSLANIDNFLTFKSQPKKSFKAKIKEAKPAAEEARPAATGILE